MSLRETPLLLALKLKTVIHVIMFCYRCHKEGYYFRCLFLEFALRLFDFMRQSMETYLSRIQGHLCRSMEVGMGNQRRGRHNLARRCIKSVNIWFIYIIFWCTCMSAASLTAYLFVHLFGSVNTLAVCNVCLRKLFTLAVSVSAHVSLLH